MKPEIKKRIEQIQKGVVPQGYKKTIVGIMPGKWKAKKLSKIAKEITRKNDGEEYSVLTISSLSGFLDQGERFSKVIAGENLAKYTLLEENEFAYNKGNSKTYPQGCIFRLEDYNKALIPNVYISFRIEEGSGNYYKQYFIAGLLNHQLSRIINTGVRNDGLLNLYDKDFFACQLLCPPLPEQEKIAEILSVWDKAIELKEQLIAQKKQQKKWLMQNLLTGEKRLPGFTGEWKEMRLGDVCTINDNVLSEKTQSDFEFWYIDLSSVDKGKITHPTLAIKFEELPSRARRLFKKDDILMSTVRPYLLGFAYIDKAYDYYVCSTGFAVVRAKEGVCSKFVYHTLFSDGVIRQMNQCLMGTNYPALNNDDVYQLYFELPPLLEQTAIAEILSTADQEIDLHEKQLEELNKQKKALMQLLLTGLVRVNV